MPPATAPSTAATPRGAWHRDPDVWLSVGCWGVVALSVLQVLLFGFGRDQSIYAVVGQGVLEGKMPYRDLWDFKPPGIFLVHALAQGALGKSMLSVRLVEALGMVALALWLRQLAGQFFGLRRVGTVGAALACLILAQLEFWHSGQPEQYGGILTVGALVLAARPESRHPRWRWLAIGALFGVAFLFKPPLGGGALVVAAYLLRREQQRGVRGLGLLWPPLLLGLGSLAVLAACAAWFAARGAWAALAWTLFEFTPGYTRLGWGTASLQSQLYYGAEQLFWSFSALLGAGFLAAVVVRPVHAREREGLFLVLGVLSVQLTGVVLQAKFFPYHYAASLILLGWLAGLGAYKLWRRALLLGAPGLAAFGSALVLLASMRLPVRDLSPDFWVRSLQRTRFLLRGAPSAEREALDRELYRVADYSLDASRQVGRELGRRVPPESSVYVWGFEPLIYWESGRRPASRYIYDVPQRAQWQRERARRELLEDLSRDPPAAIVVQHGDSFSFVTGSSTDSAQALEDFPELEVLLEGSFERTLQLEDFDLYERRPSPLPPPPFPEAPPQR